MSSHNSGSANANENLAERQCKSITSEENLEVIKRMEGGQSRPTVCRALNMAPSTVTTIMKNGDKIKKAMETARRKTTFLSYFKKKSEETPVDPKMAEDDPVYTRNPQQGHSSR
jgi:DNA-binding NarL/FixJ family response regulator